MCCLHMQEKVKDKINKYVSTFLVIVSTASFSTIHYSGFTYPTKDVCHIIMAWYTLVCLIYRPIMFYSNSFPVVQIYNVAISSGGFAEESVKAKLIKKKKT